MKRILLVMVLVTGCKSDAEKMCEDTSASPKARVSACGEQCDRDGGQACVTQTEVATEHCMKKGDAEICRWMCDYAKTGADLYCKQKEALGASSAARAPAP